MCLLLIAFKIHPHYKLLLAANRDEFYNRPTEPAAWQGNKKDVLSGTDLEAGGTWLGITRKGKLAAITNFRERGNQKENAPSRGNIVSLYLKRDTEAREYLLELESRRDAYNGFNLILGDVDHLFYYSNRAKGLTVLKPGIYGLSNSLLDVPWPKITVGKEKLAKIILEEYVYIEAIFSLLRNEQMADNEKLPDTGVGLDFERILSPLFIKTEKYGTRSSTVVLVDKKNQVFFEERSFVPPAHNQYQFKIQI